MSLFAAWTSVVLAAAPIAPPAAPPPPVPEPRRFRFACNPVPAAAPAAVQGAVQGAVRGAVRGIVEEEAPASVRTPGALQGLWRLEK